MHAAEPNLLAIVINRNLSVTYADNLQSVSNLRCVVWSHFPPRYPTTSLVERWQ